MEGDKSHPPRCGEEDWRGACSFTQLLCILLYDHLLIGLVSCLFIYSMACLVDFPEIESQSIAQASLKLKILPQCLLFKGWDSRHAVLC